MSLLHFAADVAMAEFSAGAGNDEPDVGRRIILFAELKIVLMSVEDNLYASLLKYWQEL